MLRCSTCGGHFEALAHRPGKQNGVCVCATRRRKPGACTNTLVLPIVDTDGTVLDMVEGEALGTKCIEELLALVDKGETDQTERLTADRDRLQREVSNRTRLRAVYRGPVNRPGDLAVCAPISS